MEDRIIKRATGLNGTLELLEDRVRIRRDGWTSRLYGRRHHEEYLALSQVESVQLKRTVGGLAGYISLNGGTDPDSLEDLCVSYFMPQEHQFEEMREAIETQRTQYMASPHYLTAHQFVIDNSL